MVFHLRRVMTITIVTMIMKIDRAAKPPTAPATAATGNVDSPPPPTCMEKIDEFN